MIHIEKSTDVDVSVSTAYNQWTQCEEFPRFMKGVEHVEQLDDQTVRWRAAIAGKDVEWIARITHQVPDERIAWMSTRGAKNAGSVSFYPLGATKTRVTLRLTYDAAGPLEKTGSAMGLVSARVEDDLRRFKKFIEARGHETGAWRERIHNGAVSSPKGRCA